MNDPKDRRAHPRYHVGECGYLELKVDEDAICKHEVYVADISRGGVGLFLECPVAVNTAVRVTLSKCTIDGIVAHCREDDGGWIAGLKAQKCIEHVEELRAKEPGQPDANPRREAESDQSSAVCV
jgi:hypothetical protein